MNYKSKLFLLGLVSQILAAKFSVVSFDGNCQVNINGSLTPMQKVDSLPLYTAEIKASPDTEYNYVCNGKEDIKRVLKGDNTFNELIGRKLTVYDMPEFVYPNAEPWKRSIGRTELFDPNYVPIVILDIDKSFFNNPKSGTLKSITFILKENHFTFNNVKITEVKNKEFAKFQMEIKLPDGGIYNRNVLKFRPSSEDPAFIRQILYGDIAHAIGNPVLESVSARVYTSDGSGVGLYVLQEKTGSESFVKSTFYGDGNGNIKSYETGVIYECSSGADFLTNDPNQLGGFKNILDESDPKNELLELTKKIKDVNVNDVNQIKDLEENWLDLDTLFSALALEYLAGHWDSYWFLTTNFVTFHPKEETTGSQFNYSKYKFYFIDQDFDQTWSIGMQDGLDALNYPKQPYTVHVNKGAEAWKIINNENLKYENGYRVIVDKFLGCDGQETCQTKELFENHLKKIVQHIFNPVAIKRKTDGYKERLDEEIAWDSKLTRLYKPKNPKNNFSYDDFINGIEYGVNSEYGILDWTKEIANTVCTQFKMEYDPVPLTSNNIVKAQTEAKPIDLGTPSDTSKLNTTSGTVMNKTNVVFAVIATILGTLLYF